MNRAQIKTRIRKNLADSGITRFSDDDLNEPLQDAYDDIAALTQCIVKSTTLNWVSNLSYYNFIELGVTDFLCTLAIFNNVTNLWLRDDLTVRDFDGIRIDWETWKGTPQFWAPCSPSYIAITAKYSYTASGGAFNPAAFSNAYYVGSGVSSLGTFDLLYAATAPSFTNDSDVPLIAVDMQPLLEYYVTAELLEQEEEFVKALDYWNDYSTGVAQYAERVKRLNKTDLLLRV